MKCLIISGPPAAGKTTLGCLLAARWDWTFLEKDQLYPLPEKFLAKGTQNKKYQATTRPLVYKRLAEDVAAELQHNNVIVEAPLLHEFRSGTREKEFVRFFPDGCKYKIIWIRCEQEKQYQRRLQRAARQDTHLQHRSWEEYVHQTKDLFATPKDVFVVENNTDNLKELEAQAAKLDRWAKE